MRKNFYDEENEREDIKDIDSYAGQQELDDESEEAGKIGGRISIPEIINKNRMFLVIGVVAVLLAVILSLSMEKKKENATQTYTLGDPDKVKVGTTEEENNSGSEENGELTPEEQAEMERIQQQLAAGNLNPPGVTDTSNTSGNNLNNGNYDTGNVNANYQDDTLYQNTGGFRNINFSDEESSVPNSTNTTNYIDEKEKKKEDGRKSGISFKKTEDNNKTETLPEGIGEGQVQLIQKENKELVDMDQNKQKSKKDFLNKRENEIFFSSNFVTPSLAKYELKAGTLIPGVLVTEINSDLPGSIVGFVSTNVYDFHKRRIIIPMGTKILGRYDSELSYGQNRVLIVWERLIFPNGNTLLLDNFQGVDLLGRAGMTGKVNYHGWKLLRSVVLSSLLGATTNGLGSVKVSADNKGNRSVSIGGGAADEANESLSQAVRSMIDRDLNRQPTVKIKQGSRFNIFVTKDMIIPPYKKDR